MHDDRASEHQPPTASEAVLAEVLPLVYRDLRDLAARTLRGPGTPSLQPTDLVHEAYLRLSRDRNGWTDRPNLMVAASVAMRRALIDHVRRKRAAKREGAAVRMEEGMEVAIHDRHFDVLDLEDALRELESEDAGAAEVAELRLFGGLGTTDCATALDVSTRTIERRWRFARAWLLTALGDGEPGGGGTP
ncbi:MAG: ECF-type sigma factor [Planctomycetota bacterium]